MSIAHPDARRIGQRLDMHFRYLDVSRPRIRIASPRNQTKLTLDAHLCWSAKCAGRSL